MGKLWRPLLALPAFVMVHVAQAAAPLSAVGTFDVEENDFVYAEVADLALRAHTYRPAGVFEDPLPAAVEVHGGAWNFYDRMAGEHYNRALASSGMLVMAIDFRQGPAYQHPLGSRDVAAGVRYLRAHAERLGVSADSIGLIGSSSGGHLAMLAGVTPDVPAHRGTPIRLPDGTLAPAPHTSAVVDYVIALWPVSDPAYRYRYAKEAGRDRLVAAHDAYFGSEARMREAAIARIIADGEATQPLPGLLIVQPGEDANVPRPMTFALIDAYQNAGGDLDYAFFPGQPHAFAHRPSPASDDCIRLMRAYIHRRVARLPASDPVSGG